MRQLFFTADGRINRARFWLGHVGLLGLGILATAIALLLAATPHVTSDKNVALVAAGSVVALVLMLATIAAMTWAGVCLGIKRYHDLGKPGVWVLIQFVPLIGGIWYLVEAGCIEGTRGPNLYGADSLRPELGTAMSAEQVAARTRPTSGRPGYVLPLMGLAALPGVLILAAGVAIGLRDAAWLKSAVHVEGKVTALEPAKTTEDGKTTTSYRPTYEARTPEGIPFKVKSFWAISPAPEIGSSVELVYEPGKPATTAVANSWTFWFLPAFVTGWGVIWAGLWLPALVFVALLWKREPATGTMPGR